MPRPEIFSKFQSRKFVPQKASGTSSSETLPPGMMPGPKKYLFWWEVMDRFTLDFDDAYQYCSAEKYHLTLVSFDGDF
jgi:hypothetical protein